MQEQHFTFISQWEHAVCSSFPFGFFPVFLSHFWFIGDKNTWSGFGKDVFVQNRSFHNVVMCKNGWLHPCVAFFGLFPKLQSCDMMIMWSLICDNNTLWSHFSWCGKLRPPCLRTSESFKDAAFIPNYEAITSTNHSLAFQVFCCSCLNLLLASNSKMSHIYKNQWSWGRALHTLSVYCFKLDLS